MLKTPKSPPGLPLSRRALWHVLGALIGLGNVFEVAALVLQRPFGLLRLRLFWLKPRPGDIYVATYPKSGTTWMQMILYQLITGGRGEFDHILQVAPYYERTMLTPGAEAILDALPSPRIFKTHLHWWQLRLPREARCVFVTRNPYDCLVSAYHHACARDGVHLDFEPYIRRGTRGLPMFGSWYRYMKTWWPHRNEANVLHVRYEDLKNDLEGQIRRVAAFCNLPIDERRMGDILEKCGFEYMKRHSARFDPRLSLFEKLPSKNSGFIREGGKGEKEGRAELRAEVEAQLAQLQQRLGIQRSEL